MDPEIKFAVCCIVGKDVYLIARDSSYGLFFVWESYCLPFTFSGTSRRLFVLG